jgi:radical SAM superfamily enzyme YgiQ (UPF0313 family)
MGLESGYDPLLKFMKKGVTADLQIEAGRKVKAAGMELSEYYMPVRGGRPCGANTPWNRPGC